MRESKVRRRRSRKKRKRKRWKKRRNGKSKEVLQGVTAEVPRYSKAGTNCVDGSKVVGALLHYAYFFTCKGRSLRKFGQRVPAMS